MGICNAQPLSFSLTKICNENNFLNFISNMEIIYIYFYIFIEILNEIPIP